MTTRTVLMEVEVPEGWEVESVRMNKIGSFELCATPSFRIVTPQPQPAMLAPEYTTEMGEAATEYHSRFKNAHPLPVQWRWEELWLVMLAAAPAQAAMRVPNVDDLAQFIRIVNGANDMGAGQLAERICEWIAAAPAPQADICDGACTWADHAPECHRSQQPAERE